MSADVARRALRVTGGLALGALSGLVELVYVVVAALALAVPATRAPALAGARALARLEQARVARFLGAQAADDYSGARALRYLAVRCVVGLLGAGIFLLILWGAASAVVLAVNFASGRPIDGGPESEVDWYDPLTVLLFGALLLFLAVQGLIGVAALERTLVRHFLGPSPQELLRRRVSELATSRAGVIEAVNDERRRIERDLHDGVQQRLVALGMLLGRARRAADAGHAETLLHQAHEQTQQALRELRDITWRVYPIALDEGGLHAALESVAERSGVPVRLRYRLDRRPDRATETVAYFVVSEAVSNALKHGAPNRIEVDVAGADSMIVVRVTDDGLGGANPAGTGLSGLARRVAAADGQFTVDSPAGGPTVITARLPCG